MVKWLWLLSIVLISCSSTKKKSGDYDYDQNSQARGAAYAAEPMNISKDEPDHPEIKPWQFYYKRCDMTGDPSYYSKTSYECTDPKY